MEALHRVERRVLRVSEFRPAPAGILKLHRVKALLLFSHGSVLCGSERTLEDLAARLRARGAAPIVEMGFLNYSKPLFATAFERCVQQGATEITVVPYFLVAGKFVSGGPAARNPGPAREIPPKSPSTSRTRCVFTKASRMPSCPAPPVRANPAPGETS